MIVTKKIGGRKFVFAIANADNFTVTPAMPADVASAIVWQLLVSPNYSKIRSKKPRRKGGVRG